VAVVLVVEQARGHRLLRILAARLC